jgi:hypothetical protein
MNNPLQEILDRLNKIEQSLSASSNDKTVQATPNPHLPIQGKRVRAYNCPSMGQWRVEFRKANTYIRMCNTREEAINLMKIIEG